ncbi:MAG: hypothetical protein JXC85_01250 [Candidatus Aenigmarchaeota archaeon]|nr:hypothetical protein [Candidatus Aenigmarchaeota archaeon]
MVLTIALTLVLASNLSEAISVPSAQENIDLTIERGSSYSFFMLVNDVDEEAVLTAEGEIDDWVRFGEDKKTKINVSSSFFMTIVLVTITVPEGMDLDEYTGMIKADGRKISSLAVKVTLELSDAKAFEQLSDVDKEVGNLKDKVESLTESLNMMRVDVATLEAEVSSRMQEIYEYQRNLTVLEDERDSLLSENTELESELNEFMDRSAELEESNKELNAITGSLISTQLPGMFFGGVILGIIAVTLVVKRAHVAKKLKSRVKRLAGRGKEEGFRYSFN